MYSIDRGSFADFRPNGRLFHNFSPREDRHFRIAASTLNSYLLLAKISHFPQYQSIQSSDVDFHGNFNFSCQDWKLPLTPCLYEVCQPTWASWSTYENDFDLSLPEWKGLGQDWTVWEVQFNFTKFKIQ